MSEQSKHEHRDKLVQIGIQAVEHSLRFLPQDNSTRKVVEGRLAALRSGEAKKLKEMIASIKPETAYSQENCIRRASTELLKLSVSEKWLSSMALTGQVFFPCADAGSFVGQGEESTIESKWQDETLYQQVEEAFRQSRKIK